MVKTIPVRRKSLREAERRAGAPYGCFLLWPGSAEVTVVCLPTLDLLALRSKSLASPLLWHSLLAVRTFTKKKLPNNKQRWQVGNPTAFRGCRDEANLGSLNGGRPIGTGADSVELGRAFATRT